MRALILAAAVLAFGCHHEPSRAPAPPPPLALVPPTGHSAVDRQIADLQERAERDPQKIDTWVALGRAWVRKAREAAEPGYYLNAGSAADAALALDGESAAALDVEGLVLLNDHRFAEAHAMAARVVAKNDFNPTAWGTLSDAALELGDFVGAVEAARKMMALKPNLPSYARASYLAWLQGQLDAAKRSIRLAIDASPSGRADPEPRAWAITQAAMIFWHEGDYDGADAGFTLALDGFPGFPPALVGRARVALARGEGARAAAWLEEAYGKSPLGETAWLLGDARRVAGDVAGAEAAYARLVKTGRRADPRTLALFLATMNRDVGEAVALAREEAARRGDVYTKDALAWALYRAGRLDEAAAAAEAATRLGTRDARLWYHAGAIRLARGDAAGGRALLRRALALNPKFDVTGAAEAARLLATATTTATATTVQR